jgi:hypothetical protein
MSMNPLKYLGGLVLEIGAVVAALAFIPALGGSPADFFQPAASRSPALGPAHSNQPFANQVYFDAQSTRVMDQAAFNRQPVRSAWQNDFAPPPTVADQRFVESMLDHNSQRAMDTALRVWNRGDELLPSELRTRREAAPPQQLNPPREFSPPVAARELKPRSYYAPQHRLVDDRY